MIVIKTNMNASSRNVVSIGSIVLAGLFLFPSWFETNGQYVKQLGHHFLFNKPTAVPVECYLVGCVTAPASYFHVALDRQNWISALLTIVVVIGTLLLLFRTRTDGISRGIRHSVTRWAFSGLVALALPVTVTPQLLLLGIYGVSVPRVLFSGEFGSLVYSVFFPVVFFVYTGVVYLAVTVFVWIMARTNYGVDSAS
jgi:hypothetical protein